MKTCFECLRGLRNFDLAYLNNLPERYRREEKCLGCLIKSPEFSGLFEFEKIRKQKKYCLNLLLYFVCGGVGMLLFDILAFLFFKEYTAYLIGPMGLVLPLIVVFYWYNAIKLIQTFGYSYSEWEETEYVAEGRFRTTYDDRLVLDVGEFKERTYSNSNLPWLILRYGFLALTSMFWFIPYWIYVSIKAKRLYYGEAYKAYGKTRRQHPRWDPFAGKKK